MFLIQIFKICPMELGVFGLVRSEDPKGLEGCRRGFSPTRIPVGCIRKRIIRENG